MEYVHGLGTFDPANKEKLQTGTDWNVKSLLELSHEEYERCVQACHALDTYKRDAQLFQIVLWNHEEFKELIDRYLTAYIEKNFDGLPARSPDLNLNRCLLNLLSAIRSYLDYVETSVKRKYGDASLNAAKFKKYCSDAYDSNFSYRFLYRLRNYAQHCGLPLTKISFNSGTSKRGPELVHHSLDVGIGRDELLDSNFNWGNLLKEIADQPTLIDVTYHVNQMMSRLKDIHSNYLVDEFVGLRTHASYIRGLIQKIPTEVAELHLFKLSMDPSDPLRKVGFRIQFLPLHLVDDVFDERFAILFDEAPALG
jgi:hypothetical protein